jgi:hypothetical protein
MSNNNADTNGIAEILQVILILQQNASCPESCLDSCDRPVLGCNSNCCVCNTRPVMIYSCCANGNNPVTMPISKDIITCTSDSECSSVFRVEKVENNTATFRVLAPNTEDTGLYPYVSTNSFFTLNLDCCCCLRCLNDTCVECL